MRNHYAMGSLGNGVQRSAHRIVADRALGKPLPPGAEVHHVDGNKQNNAPTNLVICESRSYHRLLHVRTRVLRAGGDPNTQRFCWKCQQLHPLGGLYGKRQAICKPCGRASAARYKQSLREAKSA